MEEPAKGRAQTNCCGPKPAAQSSCCGSANSSDPEGAQVDCCGPEGTASGAARFYSEAELDGLPESVTDISLGCGNPLAISELQAGEVVLDLGSGGGIDCFLAAKQVGPEGKVIGLDVTPEMIKLARSNAKKIGATNVDFRYGEMEDIPLPDGSVDVVISNCVINLSPDKDAVFGEVFRVLRPGGRMNVSDIVVDGDLPQPIRDSLDAWAGCVAGALDESDYLSKIRGAGFEDVQVLSRDYTDIDDLSELEDVQVIVAGPDGMIAEGEEAQALLAESGLSPHDLAHKVASVKVRARKPA
ncbi:MAG: arsenite methyltransferase [Anaerolineae bacterium]|nr:arsenite methyltransferase [Anaerolineae bacterium]